ncbi:hypothetical protein [Streptosporangium subroseum]|uniref:hypothetical protein n=1 Tax=Streptosporangium subroseum TaxID=106412 RepID=UPI00309393E4|nr:hypothetical protein OHB15_41665 [Streptosporangium subroseum]
MRRGLAIVGITQPVAAPAERHEILAHSGDLDSRSKGVRRRWRFVMGASSIPV